VRYDVSLFGSKNLAIRLDCLPTRRLLIGDTLGLGLSAVPGKFGTLFPKREPWEAQEHMAMRSMISPIAYISDMAVGCPPPLRFAIDKTAAKFRQQAKLGKALKFRRVSGLDA
jgi:hypothetical protein